MQQARAPVPWVDLAWREAGQSERAGAAANPSIVDYFRDAGHPEVTSDETAWCAAFVGACLRRSGLPNTGSLMARSYLRYGAPLVAPREGAIAVLRRGSDPSAGHVGFVLRWDGSTVWLLGGNQGDRVQVRGYARADVLGYRWPDPAPDAAWAATVAVETPPPIRTGASLAALGLAGWARVASASRTAWALALVIVKAISDAVDWLLHAAPELHGDVQGVVDPMTSLLGLVKADAPGVLSVVAVLALIIALLRHVDIRAHYGELRAQIAAATKGST